MSYIICSMTTRKKLERDQEQAVVGGVIAGLANYFNQDPLLFRVVAIALLIMTGLFPGVFLYLLAWIVVPRQRRHYDYTVVE